MQSHYNATSKLPLSALLQGAHDRLALGSVAPQAGAGLALPALLHLLAAIAGLLQLVVLGRGLAP